MSRARGSVVLGIVAALAATAAAQTPPSGRIENRLLPFATDGCSRFPDGIPFLDPTKWRRCCVAHDVAYWQGGTAAQREDADRALNRCVARTGERAIAWAMYLGVRIGGYERLPTTWHWGYGWALDRGYAAFGPDEERQVRERLKDIPADLDAIPIRPQPAIRDRVSLTGNNCLDLAASRILSRLGRGFRIVELAEEDETRADGFWKTLTVRTDACAQPFVFKLQLLRRSACADAMGELEARGRLRLRSWSGPRAECRGVDSEAPAPSDDSALSDLESRAPRDDR